jgi:CRISPR-associated protein Cas2
MPPDVRSPTRSPRPGPDKAADLPPPRRNRRHWVVVSYDIVDDRRRTQVMKTLSGYGHRVQYSVFECEVRPGDLEKLKVRLKALVHADEDDIRIYQLCETCLGKVITLGKGKRYRQVPYVVV